MAAWTQALTGAGESPVVVTLVTSPEGLIDASVPTLNATGALAPLLASVKQRSRPLFLSTYSPRSCPTRGGAPAGAAPLAGSAGISSSSKLYSLGSLAAVAVAAVAAVVLAGAPEAAGPPVAGAVAAGAVAWEAPVVAGAEGAREVG